MTDTPRNISVLHSGQLAAEKRHVPAYYFTFGLAHPLAGRFVKLYGGPEATRQLMTKIFGGNWSRQYDEGLFTDMQARRTAAGRAYTELDLGLAPAGSGADGEQH